MGPELQEGDNKLILLGDYIDRGPDSFRCLEKAYSLQKKYGKEQVKLLRWMVKLPYFYETETQINKDFDGLKTAILTILSGDEIKVRTTSFQNDMVSFRNKNDVLTLLIHMGYLAYDQNKKTAYIPNEEIRSGMLLVGNSYDKKEKTHQCSIEAYQKCKK